MGRIEGWRKSFETPESISYQSTKELYTPGMDGIIPKGTLISIQRKRSAPGWLSLSEPEGYSIDGIPFVSKRGAHDTIIDWMRSTKSTSKVSSMAITLDSYKYMEVVYLQGEENETERFVESVFIRGWKGVNKEFPTLDTLEWGFLTSEMFHDEREMIKLSKFLDIPIVDGAIELSAPETDPVRVALEKKVKIIWR